MVENYTKDLKESVYHGAIISALTVGYTMLGKTLVKMSPPSLGIVHVPNFGGLSGSEDRGGGDNSIQFINFGRVGDKSFEEWRQK